MIEILTPDEMRAAEQAAFDTGVSEPDLMAVAAGGIASWIITHVREPEGRRPVAFGLVGPGNNGGDCLVALSRLAEAGWETRALLVLREGVGDLPATEESLSRIEHVDGPAAAATADVILDGVFGVGARAELPDQVASIMDEVNTLARDAGSPRIAIDCPTGTDSENGAADDRAFRADVTLCVGFPKLGLLFEPAASASGEISVIDIGIDPPAGFSGPTMIAASRVRDLLPERKAYAHKGSSGGVLVIGGAPVYFGAPRLSGEAALRSGPGYVGLAVPRSIISAIAAQVPEVIYHPLSDGDGRRSARAVREALNESGTRYTAAILGPGLGRDEVAKAMLEELLGAPSEAETEAEQPLPFGIPRRRRDDAAGSDDGPIFGDRPVVIDADALNWLSEQDDWPGLVQGLQAVLTPHAGEMARLLDIETGEVTADPFGVALKAASASNSVVVLKVGYTCVATPEGKIFVSPRAPSELATPGSGDVLSGLIGGFLAQGLAPVDAACVAVYLGAQAGRMARTKLGALSVVARDVITYLPPVMNSLTAPRWDRAIGDGA